jgi:ubiquinone biosynthesis protein
VQPSTSATVTGFGWLHAARRLQRIGTVLARHGFIEVVERIGLSVPRLPGSAPVPLPSSRERLALRLVEVLTELGPTYVKLGQLLATRADLLPADVVQTLSKLHASVRPLPFREILGVIEHELGRPYQHAFEYLEPHCLAAASIGQVHRARLRDGQPVVVKVQRPNLRAQVEADLAIMRLFAQLLAQQVPEVAAYQPVMLVDAFTHAIRLELDFRNEAANAERLRAALHGAPEVHVPHVYAEWTRERVLVMEYIAGARLADLTPPQRMQTRQALLRAFVRQTMEHGVFHADPHPGNLLALPDGRVVLLDLGTVDVLERPLQRGLLRLGFALLLKRTHALAHAVVTLARTEDAARVNRRELERDLSQLLQTASQADGSALMGRMMSISRTHGLRLPPALLALMRALALLDGVLRGLDAHSDLVQDLRREIAWAALRRLKHSVSAPFRALFAHGAHGVRRLVGRARRDRPVS